MIEMEMRQHARGRNPSHRAHERSYLLSGGRERVSGERVREAERPVHLTFERRGQRFVTSVGQEHAPASPLHLGDLERKRALRAANRPGRHMEIENRVLHVTPPPSGTGLESAPMWNRPL